MPLFTYRAVAQDGRTVHGRIDALNLVDLEMRLKRMELDLIDGDPLNERKLLGPAGIPRRELIHFCFHLEMLVRSDVPIIEGLGDLRDTIDHPRFREVIASLIESIEGGQRLSQAMEGQPKVFDKVFISLIAAGETSGRLPEILRSLTESLKWEDELVAQSKKVLMYPLFVATIVLIATGFLMTQLVPQLKHFVTNMGQTLPAQTRALFFVSDMLVAYWYVLLALPLLIVVATVFVLRTNPLARVRFDAMKLKLPFVGEILRKIILSRFANTFALLYTSGIPVLESISSTQNIVGNLVIRQGLERVEQLISEGQNVTTAFHSAGFFPPLVIRMMRIGETTGELAVALTNVSYFYNRDVKESVEKVQQLIEPMLTVMLGLVLGWIMLSVLGPVYDIISRMKT